MTALCLDVLKNAYTFMSPWKIEKYCIKQNDRSEMVENLEIKLLSTKFICLVLYMTS